MLLDEYAIIPDVFDPRSYNPPELAGILLTSLRRPLTEEAIVANLRNGEWLELVNRNLAEYHQRAKGLIADLIKLNRIMARPPTQPGACETALGWCKEALDANLAEPMTGVVAPQALAGDIKRLKGPVETIDRLHLAGWWRPGVCSIRTERAVAAYSDVLRPVLRHANSVMLIDPHFDPGVQRYSGVPQLLGPMVGRRPAPIIEFHRVVSGGPVGDFRPRDKAYWEDRFSPLSKDFKGMGLKGTVFVWDDFHDRFLLTNHVGISMSNGFDTDGDPKARMVWNRMGRAAADDVQREFDPGSGMHKKQFDFTIGQGA